MLNLGGSWRQGSEVTESACQGICPELSYDSERRHEFVVVHSRVA